MPPDMAQRVVLPCDPAVVRSPIVFSALDAAAADEIEPAFARAGRLLLSNAKSFRMEPDVPLVIPEVNPEHLAILPAQRKARGWSGAIVTNANCAATVAAMALAPLRDLGGGISQLFLSTMQAVSGAGYPGVASLDILGNVIPFIAEEEGKIEREVPKLLGEYANDKVTAAPLRVTAHANRVAVEHGHTVCMSVAFQKPVTPEEVSRTLCAWQASSAIRSLPSAPDRALIVSDEPDRPQPRRDVMSGGGMSVVVGRIRADPVFHVRLVAMGHNTIRGAAGGSVLNAELLAATARSSIPSLA